MKSYSTSSPIPASYPVKTSIATFSIKEHELTPVITNVSSDINSLYYFANSGKIDIETITFDSGSQDNPMIRPKDIPDEIDLEIAAMTPEQLLAEILATAGAWADMENLSDDGFTDMEWGFTDLFDSDDPDDPCPPS